MSKLFVFGIGGTGSRVIKSLAMLLATGVKVNADEIVPIIIDVDKANEDLNRTIEILNNYESIHDSIVRNKYDGFFRTKISNLYQVQGKEFRIEIDDVQGNKFSEYIDYSTLSGSNKKIADLLFSADNLKLDMAQGFQGNPNLGSVVLNQFKNNKDFDTFALNFNQGDSIFIISSIHGGTGSSGFPLLVKNIRNANVPTPNSDLIKNSLIGAITVLPYYKLKQGKIKSEDFISKSKAALEYYIKNVNPSLNSLYYIGYEDTTPNYENHIGGTKQKNPAHFVELAAALSIIDFAKQDQNTLSQRGSRFLEFGLNEFQNTIDFKTLGGVTSKTIFSYLSKFYLFNLYLEKQLNLSINKQPWSNKGKIKIPKSFLTSENSFFEKVTKTHNRFAEWLSELSQNSPSFKPFNLALSKDGALNCISNIETNRKFSWKKDFVLFDDLLNSSVNKTQGLSQEQKFIELFNLATNNLFSKLYN